MFENLDDEWVAGLDVEYTTILGREKDLKDEERKKPAEITCGAPMFGFGN